MKTIKKLLIAVLMVTLCLPITVLQISAETTPTLVADTVTGAIGDTVEVGISLKNNPGLVNMRLFVTYDDANLTLVEVADTGLLSGQLHSDNLKSPYTLTWANDTIKENLTVNGTVVILKFKIKDTATVGSKYDISVSYNYDDSDIMNFDLQSLNFAVVNGSITVAEPISTITSVDVSLDKDLTVNYYVDLNANHSGAQMKFTMNGEETFVNGVAAADGKNYVYAFTGVTPQCMGDNIKAELILNGETLAAKEEFSIKAYCEDLLEWSDEKLTAMGISKAKQAKLPTLIADLLEYGAAAQVYRNYKTNELVNEGITGQSEFVALTEGDWSKELGTSSTEGTELTGAGVRFDYNTKLYFTFTVSDPTAITISVTNDEGDSTTYTSEDFIPISEEENRYILYTEAIDSTGFGDYYTVKLLNAKNRAIQTLDYYSVNAYILNKQNQTTDGTTLSPMAKLARALSNYGQSAEAYATAE